MSLYQFEVSAFTLGPRVRDSDAHLVARSNLIFEALTLFSWRRRLEVDATKRLLTVTTTTFWRQNRPREIPFHEIGRIWRTAKRFGTSHTITGETTDQVERFLVALELKSAEKIPLFTFSGEGTRKTGLGGVILGDSIVDAHGAQDRRSVAFARRLAELTGAELLDAPF